MCKDEKLFFIVFLRCNVFEIEIERVESIEF